MACPSDGSRPRRDGPRTAPLGGTIYVRCGPQEFSAQPLSLDGCYLDCRPVVIGVALLQRLKNLKLRSAFARRGGLECAWSRDRRTWNAGAVMGIADGCVCIRLTPAG